MKGSVHTCKISEKDTLQDGKSLELLKDWDDVVQFVGLRDESGG